jgi:PadR family transcriptional regulator PadR
VRQTYAKVQVALALNSEPGHRHYGYDLSKKSGVRSGVMYPILRRMLEAGWLADGWEDNAKGKPPRRYYRITDLGMAELGAVVAAARRDARFRPLFAPVIAGSGTITT